MTGRQQGLNKMRRALTIRRRWLVPAAAAIAVAAVIPSPHASASATPMPLAPLGELAPLAPVPPAGQVTAADADGWTATWAAAPVAPLTHGPSAKGFDDQTVRQTVRTSIGGPEVRLQLTNAFGPRPVHVGGATLAVQGHGAALVPGTGHGITVDGSRSFTIPAGGTLTTDPVDVPVGTGTDLAVSTWFDGATGPATWHPLGLTTNYVASGDHVADPGPAGFGRTTSSWWFVSGVDVLAPANERAVVAFGASTSDGEGTRANANARWVDDLNRTLDTRPGAPAVIDEGIAGNRLLASGPADGQSGEQRFAADAIDQPGVGTILVSSLGNDDIGHGRKVSADQLIAGYQQLIAQAHAHGKRIIGCTLTPDRGNGMWTPAGEQIREQVNHWILTSHAFDGTVDFSSILAAPGHPERLAHGYDSGDHLHPNAAGYAAIAAALAPVLQMGSLA